MNIQSDFFDIGFDVGSTTIKAVVLDPKSHQILFSKYVRHHAKQSECLSALISEIEAQYPEYAFRAAITGSGGSELAKKLNVPYVQEVVANAIAVQKLHPQVRTAIELGGQDAKMIFFALDSTGQLNVSDMRMNGSCAGGTGAFIDEIAALLNIPIEEFNAFAKRGQTVHSISGRCGVYAKTDIQPLLNSGVSKEDLALSSFHAIAKQTIGGLAQGLDIHPPVIFEGGPLTFNTQLVQVFIERLGLSDDEVVIPDHPETIVARGAALSLQSLTAGDAHQVELPQLRTILDGLDPQEYATDNGRIYFENALEKAEFLGRHKLADQNGCFPSPGQTVSCYLGIDSGSTTTKMALLGPQEELLWSFYASNQGDPITTACHALTQLKELAESRSVTLNIESVGTTGYGELLLAEAFHAPFHTVETVAHATAARKYEPEASFILDIGGQDMKAIWLDNGIITNIVVNEACSSGCGSFLEGFASSLNIPVKQIASSAFESQNPADLGSRCTVFMNSSIVTAQRCGKGPDDIMAGLCRSIIENVFTKVIRVSNIEKLGKHIVVQGGTFMNDAVLRAFEQYLDMPVTRSPYPGLMGAIGAALLAAQQNGRLQKEGKDASSTFIGLDAVQNLQYTQETGVICHRCQNACSRTVVTFSTGSVFVTGNRCERGAVLDNPAGKTPVSTLDKIPNVFGLRERLLMKDWPLDAEPAQRDITIGLPRVLFYWETMPFWKTFFRQLGFRVKLSHSSSRTMYENGLSAVPSDTICFPAKLVHGHIRDLVKQGVDRILMPSVTTVESQTTEATSISMCAVVKGYGMVIRNSDNPETKYGVPFDNPLFHWFTQTDKENQLVTYMKEHYGIEKDAVLAAVKCADKAQEAFAEQLVAAGEQAITQARQAGSYVVILGGRPYHNDRLVNHDLPKMFAERGVCALPSDAVPGVYDVDLSHCLIDIVNNYHARMLASAILAAQNDYLEFAQVVSFGCGHDAYLTDEIIRVMNELGHKAPLVMKVDESDAHGPLSIRLRSFIETVNERREIEALSKREILESLQLANDQDVTPALLSAAKDSCAVNESCDHCGAATKCRVLQACDSLASETKSLSDPYPVKFQKTDKAIKTVLVPNTSHAFSRLMAVAFAHQGLKAVSLPVGREEAIRLGKKYVHNDICFPAQIVIGEALAELETGKYDPETTAVATGKYIGDCRLTHYAALLRKALDDAGYEQIPIVTNDDVDYHHIHPGYSMNLSSSFEIVVGLPMIDALEDLLRKMRPYELVPGSANEAFDKSIDLVMDGLEHHGVSGAKKAFREAIQIMKSVQYDRSHPRPTVLIVGEYLLNFHPGANHDIELLLESNGLEIIEAKMTDVIRKTYFYQDAQVHDYGVHRSVKTKVWNKLANRLFEMAHDITDSIAKDHPLYEPPTRMPELVIDSNSIIHRTFDAGEGVLIPAEILHNYKHGCRAFVILQPFGCLPNHVVGRGIAKKLKELCPDAQLLPLDFDPDVSFANVENRLQMMVMNLKATQQLSSSR